MAIDRFPISLPLLKNGHNGPWSPTEENPIWILEWNTSESRMGQWVLTATVYYPISLDPFLSDDIYVELDGLKWVLDGSRSSVVLMRASAQNRQKYHLRIPPTWRPYKLVLKLMGSLSR